MGKYIVDELERSGEEVFITTRYVKEANHIRADFENNILELRSGAGVRKKENALLSFDYVIHAAGKAHIIPKTEEEKNAFFKVNTGGTKLLLEKLESLTTLPKGLVFISSVAVYGEDMGTDIKEDHTLNADSPYGKSKIEAENMLLTWGKKNNVVIGIARLPLIAGKDSPGNFYSLINGIKTGRYFRIGKGNARKSMVWAADIAKILPKLAQNGGVYNFTDGYAPSFSELEDAITAALKLKPVKKMPIILAKLVGLTGTIIEKLIGIKMPINNGMLLKITSKLTFSDEKARTELGWNPSRVLSHVNEMI